MSWYYDEEIDYTKADFIREHSTEITTILEIAREKLLLKPDEEIMMSDHVFDSITRLVKMIGLSVKNTEMLIDVIIEHMSGGYGIIEPLLEDDSVNEIMVNGPYEIFYESNGEMKSYDNAFISDDELEALIRKIASGVHREINEANPIVDARMESGYRVNGILKNIAINGPVLTIRKFGNKEDDNIWIEYDWGLPDDKKDLLCDLVGAGYNIFISGGTSSGKTTFLNGLSMGGINMKERVIVIEDSAELDVGYIPNVVSLECRAANSLGKGQVTISDLIRTSLRMRPDRIIVGEVRGAEVVDMIQAMNTGHDGSLSTGHGNSIAGMLSRLEAMYMMGADVPISAIRQQIANAIDIMVHMKRDAGGRRFVSEIAELVGLSEGEYELNYLYVTDSHGTEVSGGGELIHRDKLDLFYDNDDERWYYLCKTSDHIN